MTCGETGNSVATGLVQGFFEKQESREQQHLGSGYVAKCHFDQARAVSLIDYPALDQKPGPFYRLEVFDAHVQRKQPPVLAFTRTGAYGSKPNEINIGGSETTK